MIILGRKKKTVNGLLLNRRSFLKVEFLALRFEKSVIVPLVSTTWGADRVFI